MTSPTADDDLNASLLKGLECPICFEHCTPPIYMCPESHSVCIACLGQITACPICRGPKPTIRNRLAETMSAKVRFPCPRDGCEGRYTLAELDRHLPTCGFTCRCYAGSFDCTWRGRDTELFDHVTSVHPDYLGGKAAFTVEYQLPLLWNNLCGTLSNLCKAHSRLFWVRMFYEGREPPAANHYCFNAVCVGPRGDDGAPAKYRCEFRFSSGDRSYENVLRVPVSYEHDLRYDDGCIRLSDRFMKHFIVDNVLRCKVTILEK